MSNPYDPTKGPNQSGGQYGGQNPYGAPQGQPYGAPEPGQGGSGFGSGSGGSPYGGPPGGGSPYGGNGGNPYGGNEPQGTDAVSITGFVLSLTCCLSVVGAIMGFIGLGRTKNNQRKGRWAAVAAIPIGILGTLALIGFVVVIVFVAKNQITPDNATVGQCGNTDTEDNQVSLTKKECSESHDAQIVYVGKAGDDADRIQGSAGAVCIERSAGLTALDPAEYNLRAVIEDPSDVDADDRFVCYIEKADGGKLTEKVDVG